MSSDKRLPYVVDKVDEPTFIIEPGNFKKYLINCLKLPLLQVPDEIMGYVQKYEGDLIEYCKVSTVSKFCFSLRARCRCQEH